MRDHAFPAMKWHPESGESQVFTSASDVPEGWLDHHPKHFDGQKPPPAAKPVEAPPMERADVLAALKRCGIDFKPTTGTKALYTLLVTSLKEHFTTEKVEFKEDATATELLALLPPEE